MSAALPIIVRLQGGLGNQLYQYAIGRAVALQSGRELLLDDRLIEREAPARHYDLGAFNIREKHAAGLTRWCVRWLCSIRLGRVFKLLCPLAWPYRLLQDQQAGFDASVLAPHPGPVILQGYWQSFKYFESHRKLLLDEFTLKASPDAANREVLAEISRVNSVAVHVRRGDYANNPEANAIHGTCGLGYYEAAAKFIMDRLCQPKFFLFTDDPSWAASNVSLPGPVYVVRHNLGKCDYEDLRLLSQCQHFIIANSSFSWWGAWLAQHPHKIVVAPAKWFNQDNCPPEDRIPPEWVRL